MTMFWAEGLDPDHEPHKVMIARDELMDTARDNRPVKIKVYYPVNHTMTNLPVIVWSHGLGGSADGAAFLSRFMAAHGYVMVHVQHLGTDSSIWEGKPGHPWDVIRATPITRDTTLNRYADIPFVLNQLPAWMEANPEVGLHADLSTLGMSGHSFGALTAQVMAGMRFPDAKGELLDLQDTRFKAGILYSPGSIEHLGDMDPKEVYPSINIPLFHMTGTEDGSPLSDLGYEMRLTVYENTHTEKHLLVLKDGDHMVFAGSRGKLGHTSNRKTHEAIIKIASLAYWDAHLKDDKAAQEWLTAGGLKAYLGGNATYESQMKAA